MGLMWDCCKSFNCCSSSSEVTKTRKDSYQVRIDEIPSTPNNVNQTANSLFGQSTHSSHSSSPSLRGSTTEISANKPSVSKSPKITVQGAAKKNLQPEPPVLQLETSYVQSIAQQQISQSVTLSVANAPSSIGSSSPSSSSSSSSSSGPVLKSIPLPFADPSRTGKVRLQPIQSKESKILNVNNSLTHFKIAYIDYLKAKEKFEETRKFSKEELLKMQKHQSMRSLEEIRKKIVVDPTQGIKLKRERERLQKKLPEATKEELKILEPRIKDINIVLEKLEKKENIDSKNIDIDDIDALLEIVGMLNEQNEAKPEAALRNACSQLVQKQQAFITLVEKLNEQEKSMISSKMKIVLTEGEERVCSSGKKNEDGEHENLRIKKKQIQTSNQYIESHSSYIESREDLNCVSFREEQSRSEGICKTAQNEHPKLWPKSGIRN